MINLNGDIVSSDATISNTNRSFLYGDGVFETLKIVNNKILFFEDHYFRLMASMRIVRMKIPATFTMEFLESEILELAKANDCAHSARVRFTVFRCDGGYYLPTTNQISYLISSSKLGDTDYKFNNSEYEVDLYKDFFIPKQLLSTLKTANKMIHVTGSIFAEENGFKNCILLNNEKSAIETLNGNLFMLLENRLITPPISEGCQNGIIRKQILKLKNLDDIEIIEAPISPFDLQKASELFTSNIIVGVQPITKYRKKEFDTRSSEMIINRLNDLISN